MLPALFSNIKALTAEGIAQALRDLVDTGELAPGEMLPAIRSFADHLGVNRNTVASAYKKLQVAGVVEASGRAGSRVALSADDPIPGLDGAHTNSHVVDLAAGNPDPDLLPRLTSKHMQAGGPRKLYGPDVDYPPLHEWARNCFSVDGVDSDSCCITSGVMDSIERALLAHLRPGDRVAVENPCFVATLNVLRQLGLTPVGVAMDQEGMQPGHLAEVLETGVRALICTPRAQNPTSVSITVVRQEELRALLGLYPNVLVIEDDHFAFLAAEPMRSVIPETTRHWVIARSLSKHLGPDLRVGMMVSDSATYQRVRKRQAAGVRWISHTLQAMAHSLATDPIACRQVEEAAARYRERRLTMTSELARHSIVVTGTTGINVWLPLRSDRGVAAALAASGWLVRDSSAFTVDQPVPGIRVSTATISSIAARAFAESVSTVLQRGFVSSYG